MESPKRVRLIEEEEEERMEMEMEMEMELEMETKRRRRFMENNESEFLPPEIKTEILSRLPADSAIGCRGICKPWRDLIDHKVFFDTHTRQVISSLSTSNPKKFGNYLIPNSSTSSSGLFLCALQDYTTFGLRFLEYNDVVDGVLKLKRSKYTRHPFPFYLDKWGDLLMSSCNGLVFMGSIIPNYVNDIFVCNLFTKEYVNLSLLLRSSTTITQVELRRRLERKGYMTYGFGYLPSTNEYKVVSIYYLNLNGAKGEVSVYTIGYSGSRRWRNKGEIPYWLYNALHPGFFANGAIHWINNSNFREIVTFDLATEEFRKVVPSPPHAPSVNHDDQFGVLGGCLCMTRSVKTRCESPKDIWVLNIDTKKKREKQFLWNKRFSIPWNGTTTYEAEPLVILRSGKVLLRGRLGLISYDPKTGAFNEKRKRDFYNDNMLKMIPYTKSFISLKSLGEEHTKCFGGFVSYALAQRQIVVNSNIKNQL